MNFKWTNAWFSLLRFRELLNYWIIIANNLEIFVQNSTKSKPPSESMVSIAYFHSEQVLNSECLNSDLIGDFSRKEGGEDASLQVCWTLRDDRRQGNVKTWSGLGFPGGGELVPAVGRKSLVGRGRSYYRGRPPFYRGQDKRPKNIDALARFIAAKRGPFSPAMSPGRWPIL